jgi:hypothetical protein
MKRVAALAAAGCLLGLLCGAVAVAGAKPKLRLPDKIRWGKASADGVFTVGREETVGVSKMLRKVKLAAWIEPGGPECEGGTTPATFIYCYPVDLRPAPGTPAFRTTGGGRATLTFVMPTGYQQFRIQDLTASTVNFESGQPVEIVAVGEHTRGHGRRSKIVASSAHADALIEIPPSP